MTLREQIPELTDGEWRLLERELSERVIDPTEELWFSKHLPKTVEELMEYTVKVRDRLRATQRNNLHNLIWGKEEDERT